MNNKNIPIAIIYCIFTVLSIPLLIYNIFRIFSFGNSYQKICYLILGISIFFYALFNTLSHWITKNNHTPKPLIKMSRITSSLIISAILLSYAFGILTGASRWVMFGLVCLFFLYNELFFSIWTNIPFFLSEIFKDSNYIVYLIFLPNIISFFTKNNFLLFLVLTITCFILIIISLVFKYIYAKQKRIGLYTASKLLSICALIFQILILLPSLP